MPEPNITTSTAPSTTSNTLTTTPPNPTKSTSQNPNGSSFSASFVGKHFLQRRKTIHDIINLDILNHLISSTKSTSGSTSNNSQNSNNNNPSGQKVSSSSTSSPSSQCKALNESLSSTSSASASNVKTRKSSFKKSNIENTIANIITSAPFSPSQHQATTSSSTLTKQPSQLNVNAERQVSTSQETPSLDHLKDTDRVYDEEQEDDNEENLAKSSLNFTRELVKQGQVQLLNVR